MYAFESALRLHDYRSASVSAACSSGVTRHGVWPVPWEHAAVEPLPSTRRGQGLSGMSVAVSGRRLLRRRQTRP